MVALTFIGWTQGVERAYQATSALPVAFAINCVFLLTYAVAVRRGLAVGIAAALAAWASLQGLLVWRGAPRYTVGLAIWAVTLVAVYLVMDRGLRLRGHERVRVRRARWDIPARGLRAAGSSWQR